MKYIFFDLYITLIDVKKAQYVAIEDLYNVYKFDKVVDVDTFIKKWDELTDYHYAFYTRKEISYEEQRNRRIIDLSRHSRDECRDFFMFLIERREKMKTDIIVENNYSDFEIDFNTENCIQILEYTTGNRIKTIKIGNHNLSGVEVRQIFGLKSANFIIDVSDSIRFKVIGYGHGVGMSQTGADSLAKQGYKYEDIIKHFYTGVEVKGW